MAMLKKKKAITACNEVCTLDQLKALKIVCCCVNYIILQLRESIVLYDFNVFSLIYKKLEKHESRFNEVIKFEH